jgi:putative tryptophan/tyrosine transport system substrate-binding protein
MAIHIKRREFITLLGGAAAWPIAARGQQDERVRRIALFPLGAESDPEGQAYVRALRQGLEKLGWIDGQNVRIDIRWATGESGRMQADVAEALGLAPDVIVSGGTPVTREVRQKTRTIPIVFVNVGDPLTGGLVQSLAHPGGNVTGFALLESSTGGKWLELLKEIAPRVNQILVLVDPQNPTWKFHVPAIEAAAHSLAMPLTAAHVQNAPEIENAIGAFAGEPNVGTIVLSSPFILAHRELIIALAAKHQLPAIYATRSYVTSGGLPTVPTGLISTGKRHPMSIASSRAPSPAIYPSNNRPGSSWRSTSKLPRLLVSTCPGNFGNSPMK